MTSLGRAVLVIALLVACYAVAASLYGARSGKREWIVSSRRAVYALAALLTLAFAVVEVAFLRSDFSLRLVAEGSSTTTPTFYKLTAMWATQE
ncbi:hypothetical protein LCGC14_3118040, partial [marine sediment metagenome]